MVKKLSSYFFDKNYPNNIRAKLSINNTVYYKVFI